MTFIKLTKDEPIQAGALYRSTYYLGVPYNDKVADALVGGIRAVFGNIVAQRWITLVSAQVFPPSATSQDHTGRYEKWMIQVQWRGK